MGMLEHLMQNPIEKEWLNIDKMDQNKSSIKIAFILIDCDGILRCRVRPRYYEIKRYGNVATRNSRKR